MRQVFFSAIVAAMVLMAGGCEPVADGDEGQAAAGGASVPAADAADTAASAQTELPISEALEPVEDDMHEFMEYVFEPGYKRLKEAMAAEPADNAAWKVIKAEALVLAEAGNLVIIRGGDEDRTAWIAHASQSRTHGGKLYAAAREKNYAAAQEHWKAMLQSCNACHDQFAGGEHQLAP